jgi:hypothetical protein
LAANLNENDVVTHAAQNLFQPFFTTEPPMPSSPDYNQCAPAQDPLQAKISVAAHTGSNGHVLLSCTRLKDERTLLLCGDVKRYGWFVQREATWNDFHPE